DYIKSGLFRIIRNGKIGYANPEGKIVIEPRFDCAFPFEGDFARVSDECVTIDDGEHTSWQSESWYLITKNGKPVKDE
ncbi:MAG TPA: WG repeat-containing protein, partial [Desulfobacterales bacterium]|nr:WG repeat-containing protein [Desulfobacterales bacterium]